MLVDYHHQHQHQPCPPLLRRFRLELVIDLRRAISPLPLPRTGKQGVSVALHQSIVGGKTGPCFEACLRCIIGTVLCNVPDIFLTGLCEMIGTYLT